MFGQLRQIVDADGLISTFDYDPLGRRVQVIVDGTVTRFGYDGGDAKLEFDGTNALQKWNTSGPMGELLARYDAVTGDVEGGVLDHMGSVKGFTGRVGEPV